jgi:beta-lactamase class A
VPQPPAPPPSPKPRSFDQLAADINSVSGGASVGVTLIELGGNTPATWTSNGDQLFTAASTYKLPLLMAEADAIANGRAGANDQLCYQDGDWEDGYFGDYAGGSCYTRIDLMTRVGQFSDNTAAHILVRYLGGPDALNSYAQAHGARASVFFDPNVTTSSDLARLWASEASGQAGGKEAQQILYPLLTHTHWESGAPAGVPGSATVVHKVGMINAVDNDAALIMGGPKGNYILVVCTDGLGGDAGWALIAQINAKVWAYEAARQ